MADEQLLHDLGRLHAGHDSARNTVLRHSLERLRAEVVTMNGFSSHAGRSELLAMLAPLAGRVGKVRLVHGDPDQAAALEPALRAQGFADVAYPDRGESAAVGQ